MNLNDFFEFVDVESMSSKIQLENANFVRISCINRFHLYIY
jgi:hypothetical protein